MRYLLVAVVVSGALTMPATYSARAGATTIEGKCKGIARSHVLAECLDTEARRQAQPLVSKACNTRKCLYRLSYAGKGIFRNGPVTMYCSKSNDAFNGWPGHRCTVEGTPFGTRVIAQTCGSRDCEWQGDDGISIRGASIMGSSVENLKPGTKLLLEIGRAR